MGIRYSSIESQELIQAMRHNVSIAHQVTERLSNGCDHLLATLDSGRLKGAAYTAGRGLFSEVIVPAIQKLQEAVDDIEAELRSYEYADSIVSEYGYLDRDQLTQQLAIKRQELELFDEQLAVHSSFITQVQAFFTGDLEEIWSQISILDEIKMRLEIGIQDLESRIQKLDWFVNDVSRYFSDSLEVLQLAIEGALALSQITVDTNGYYYSNGTNMAWLSTLAGYSIRTFDRGMDPKLSLIQENILDLMLSEEAASYYRKQLRELLEGKPSEEWPFLIASYNQFLWFDDKGNIIDVIPFSGGSGEGLLVLKNGKYDLAYTKQANQEYSNEQWDNIKDYAGQLVLGLLELFGAMGTGMAGTTFAAGGFALSLPSGGTITIPATALAGASFALSGSLAVAGTAHVNDAIIQIAAAQAQFQVSFAQNHDDWKVNKPASRSFGKKVSGRVNGKKVDNIRVDAEPHSGKIQIQSGSGKSGYDVNAHAFNNKFTDIQSARKWIDTIPELKNLTNAAKDELARNVMKAVKWLRGME